MAIPIRIPTPTPTPTDPTPRSRRWLRRLTLDALIIAVALVLAWRFGPPIYLQARLLYFQNLCLNYSPPAGEAALAYHNTLRPFDVLHLAVNSPSPYQHDDDGDSPDLDDGCPLVPIHTPPIGGAGDLPALLMLHSRMFNALLSDGFQPIFLHGRHAPNQPDRLVLVSYGSDQLETIPGTGQFEITVIKPATTFSPPKRLWITRISLPNTLRCASLQLFQGTPDPSNPTAFTLSYIRDNHPGQLHGHLNADNRTATLTP